MKAATQTGAKLSEGENIGQAINDAMRAVETENADLKDVLPKTYNRLEKATLAELLKLMNSAPMDIEVDAFGKIYEYFAVYQHVYDSYYGANRSIYSAAA